MKRECELYERKVEFRNRKSPKVIKIQPRYMLMSDRLFVLICRVVFVCGIKQNNLW